MNAVKVVVHIGTVAWTLLLTFVCVLVALSSSAGTATAVAAVFGVLILATWTVTYGVGIIIDAWPRKPELYTTYPQPGQKFKRVL